MTPEQIAFEQRLATRDMQTDYSPVGHWAQGAARVAQNLAGALRYRNANKAADANADYSRQIMANLANLNATASASGSPQSSGTPSPGATDPVLAAMIEGMTSPYVDDSVRKFAFDQYQTSTKRAQPIEVNGKIVDPTTMKVLGDFSSAPEVVQLSRIANDPSQPEHVRAAAQARITAMNDPRVAASLPGGGFFMGPASTFGATTGAAPAQPMGSALPPGFTLDGGGEAAPGQNANVISPSDAAAMRQSLGEAGFQQWMRAHGVTEGQ